MAKPEISIPSDEAKLLERIEEKIDSLKIAGTSIALYSRGQTRVAASGYANIEAGIEADTDTVFSIGSITKVFTATVIMKLVEQGLIELDSPVSKYLPELKIQHAKTPDSLTVRSLLDYSAGMEGDYFVDFGPAPESLEKYVASCEQLQYIHPPGEMRAYNSTSYCIAGRLIEVVCGGFYNEILEELLLKPLGIEKFGFYTHDVLRYRTAIGHKWNEELKGLEAEQNLRLPHCMSAAGSSLAMSAKDLLRFGLFHLNQGVTSNGSRLLQPESVSEMQTPFKIVPPNDSELLLGWASLSSNKGPVTVASGATSGQSSFLAFNSELDLAIAILSNTQAGATQLFLELGVALFEEEAGVIIAPPITSTPSAQPIELSQTELAGYTGRYKNGTSIDVTLVDGELKFTSTEATSNAESNSESGNLIPVGNNKFLTASEHTPDNQMLIEFFHLDTESNNASHLSVLNRIFAREIATD